MGVRKAAICKLDRPRWTNVKLHSHDRLFWRRSCGPILRQITHHRGYDVGTACVFIVHDFGLTNRRALLAQLGFHLVVNGGKRHPAVMKRRDDNGEVRCRPPGHG